MTVTDPYGVVVSGKEYDANGNVIKEIDAKGYLAGAYGIQYTYDLANRLIAVSDREGGTKKYDYNQYYQILNSKNINIISVNSLS